MAFKNAVGKGENAGDQHFLFSFPTMCSTLLNADRNNHFNKIKLVVWSRLKCFYFLTITRRQILDSSKWKGFADDNFRFDENGSKLSKHLENIVGKGEIARYEQFLLFPQCFQKACFPGGVKRCHCVGMG